MDKNKKPFKLGDILKSINKESIVEKAQKEKEKAYDIRRIFEQMELDLISSMKKAFYFHKNEQQREGFEWEQWQLSKLRAIEEYRKRNKKIVDDYSNPIQETINRELNDSQKNGTDRFLKFGSRLLDRVKKFFGLKEDFKVDAELGLPQDIAEQQKLRKYIDEMLGRKSQVQEDKDFFGMNDKKLEALQKSVSNDIKNAQYSVLRKMDDVYRQTIFKTQVYMQSGVKSLDKAIDMATKDFLKQGINSITYKDGKKVNIASYAEMCLRTASQRATFLAEGKKRDEWGIHLVVISAHANTCEKCMTWQAKILIDDVFCHGTKRDGEYPLLSEAIKSGFLHPNCRHTLITYFPGITKVPVIQDGELAIKTYESEQIQRGLERDIRKYKRIAAGTLDPLEEGYANAKVKQLQQTLKTHLTYNTKLRRAEKREENRIPISRSGDNGINNGNEYINIPTSTIEHADIGEFTNPKNPKKIKNNEIKLKSGGHGENGINLLKEKGIEYNIVKEYSNGVRIGNVPNHKVPFKRIDTGQAWFPKDWTANDIEQSAKFVANLKVKNNYMIQKNFSEDKLISIFKFANYKGVTVGVCYDVDKGQITTIFPDENQRTIGGADNDR